jgi:hypothetical protein
MTAIIIIIISFYVTLVIFILCKRRKITFIFLIEKYEL